MVRYASSTSNWRLALGLIDEMNKAQSSKVKDLFEVSVVKGCNHD